MISELNKSMSHLFRAACTGKSWQDGKEESCPAAGGWSRCTSFISTPFSDTFAVFSPQAGPFPCTLVVPPLHRWLSPRGARQTAGRGAQSLPGAHRQQQGDRLLLMSKGCQDHGIQTSSSSQPGCALQAGKVPARDSAGTSSCLEVSPTL